MSRAWILLGIVLALIAATAAGFKAGMHLKQVEWDAAKGQHQAAVQHANAVHERHVHATDNDAADIDTVHASMLARSAPTAVRNQEETRHAIEHAPNLRSFVLPADLVQLRRRQAEESADIAQRAARAIQGRRDAVQAAGL